MKNSFASFLFLFSLTLSAQQLPLTISSPSNNISVTVELTKDGEPNYSVVFNGQQVIAKSKLGFELKSGSMKNFTLTDIKTSSNDDTWKPVWGEVSNIRNHYSEGIFMLKENSTQMPMNIIFRVFDDGIGFRYEFPETNQELVVADEMTQFQLTEDLSAFWIPGDWDSNEYRYSTTHVSAINRTKAFSEEHSISTATSININFIQTPVAFHSEKKNRYYMAIHEAALVDFPAMQLKVNTATYELKALLTPSPDSTIKAAIKTPFRSPWRAILLSKDAAGILSSKIILNLNEPSKIEDVSWITPMKFVGVWWAMHVGTATWEYYGADGKPSGRHGATTENVKRYIDFAAKNGFGGVLAEGWNIGWENWFGRWIDSVFSFTTSYPDYDVAEVSRYAKEKGVTIIGHHETSSAVSNYESQMDSAYGFCNYYGWKAIKTGYVGRIVPRGEWHDGQWMVNHYVRVAEKTAQHHIMLDAHEPARSTGLHRTYPNWMACEAARGNEFNAWSRGNLPEHETILPFTRLLGGPMDYTPGIFEIKMNHYDKSKNEQVHTTVAKQLALYVTMYSPLQMAADLIENYEKRMDVFQFIKDVAVDWDDTKIINAEIGDYITIARKAKGTDNWFIGSITDEKKRDFSVKLDFLDKDKNYTATIYEDGKNAHWEKNPYPVSIRILKVKQGSVLKLSLAAGGGTAISIMPVKK